MECLGEEMTRFEDEEPSFESRKNQSMVEGQRRILQQIFRKEAG